MYECMVYLAFWVIHTLILSQVKISFADSRSFIWLDPDSQENSKIQIQVKLARIGWFTFIHMVFTFIHIIDTI
jgi:hypothetical protein